MGKSTIISTLLVLFLGFLTKFLNDLGGFRRITPFGGDHCHLRFPHSGSPMAFEDIAMDYENGVFYAPGDDRSWWSSFNLSSETKNKLGEIFTFDLESEKFEQLELLNYPHEHFHPLGIGLLKSKPCQLFITNFRTENEKFAVSVEIFQHDPNENTKLKWIESVTHPLFTAPDDVLVIDENSFYVTNVYHYRKDQSAFLHKFEILSRRAWTNILFCVKSNEWNCSIAVDSVITGNGLASSIDHKTVYLAASAEKQIRLFERDIKTGSLKQIATRSVPFLIDNIVVNDEDQLIAAGHPNAFAFLSHEKNPKIHKAPSEVIIFKDPKSSSIYEHLIEDEGQLMSAITVGATYKQKTFYGAIFDAGILVC